MQLTDLTWSKVAELSKDTPVLFPVAALEQHGRHMPLFTDSLLLGEMLRLAPHLVGDLSRIEAVDFGRPFEPAWRGWITKDRTTVGHIGDPRQATAEKGEALFGVFAADVVSLLERVLAWDGRGWDG